MTTQTTFAWIIDSSALELFSQAKPGKYWKSNNFFISPRLTNDTIMHLKCYPAGISALQVESFDVAIFSNKIPSDISSITMKIRLFCEETLSERRDIFTFSHTNRVYIWPKYCMRDSEIFFYLSPNSNKNTTSNTIFNRTLTLMNSTSSSAKDMNHPSNIGYKHAQLTIRCELDIIDIYYKCQGANVIGQSIHSIIYQKPIKQYINYEWKLSEYLIDHILRQCKTGKLLYSPAFEYDVWCVCLHREQNQCLMGLQLLQLPVGFYAITVQFTLYCILPPTTKTTNFGYDPGHKSNTSLTSNSSVIRIFNDLDDSKFSPNNKQKRRKKTIIEWPHVVHTFKYDENLIFWPKHTMTYDWITNIDTQDVEYDGVVCGVKMKILSFGRLNNSTISYFDWENNQQGCKKQMMIDMHPRLMKQNTSPFPSSSTIYNTRTESATVNTRKNKRNKKNRKVRMKNKKLKKLKKKKRSMSESSNVYKISPINVNNNNLEINDKCSSVPPSMNVNIYQKHLKSQTPMEAMMSMNVMSAANSIIIPTVGNYNESVSEKCFMNEKSITSISQYIRQSLNDIQFNVEKLQNQISLLNKDGQLPVKNVGKGKYNITDIVKRFKRFKHEISKIKKIQSQQQIIINQCVISSNKRKKNGRKKKRLKNVKSSKSKLLPANIPLFSGSKSLDSNLQQRDRITSSMPSTPCMASYFSGGIEHQLNEENNYILATVSDENSPIDMKEMEEMEEVMVDMISYNAEEKFYEEEKYNEEDDDDENLENIVDVEKYNEEDDDDENLENIVDVENDDSSDTSSSYL